MWHGVVRDSPAEEGWSGGFGAWRPGEAGSCLPYFSSQGRRKDVGATDEAGMSADC